MERKRNNYDKEFKLSAVKMVVEGGRSTTSVARDLGINANSLHNWKRAYLEDSDNTFPGKGHSKPWQEELQRLHKELSEVKMEREILKKAITYFKNTKD